MVFCGKCGQKLPDSARFCGKCGNPISGGAPGGGSGGSGGSGPKMAKPRVAPNAPSQPPSGSQGFVQGKWTEGSAFDTDLALKEGQRWIEEVTGEQFKDPDNFQISTMDGILLCKLVNRIKPGIVPTINRQNTAFANRENIAQFIAACKRLGLKETQCFTTNSLYEGTRLRDVAITLYWLGRAARALGFRGPQLRISMFCKMTCTACKKPILDEDYVVDMNNQWHTKCAPGGHGGGGPGDCSGCGNPISEGDDYVDGPTGPLCDNCHCCNCNSPVGNNGISTPSGHMYCPKCACYACKRPF